jgi:hypothetical protein
VSPYRRREQKRTESEEDGPPQPKHVTRRQHERRPATLSTNQAPPAMLIVNVAFMLKFRGG